MKDKPETTHVPAINTGYGQPCFVTGSGSAADDRTKPMRQLFKRRRYLLRTEAFQDEAERARAWNTFRADPEWLKLKAIPEYEDKRIVSKITNKLLTSAEYSQF